MIEALHAATFYYENGPYELATSKLHFARARGGPSDAIAQQLLRGLADIESQLEGDAFEIRARTEELRLLLADWACLDDAMHRQFHLALPGPP